MAQHLQHSQYDSLKKIKAMSKIVSDAELNALIGDVGGQDCQSRNSIEGLFLHKLLNQQFDLDSALDETSKTDLNVNMIKKIPVQLSVEAGRKKILIQELMELKIGSVIELAGNINDELKIYANDILIAHGEFILNNEKLAVRFTEILEQDKQPA